MTIKKVKKIEGKRFRVSSHLNVTVPTSTTQGSCPENPEQVGKETKAFDPLAETSSVTEAKQGGSG
jgi:hypothetical protein